MNMDVVIKDILTEVERAEEKFPKWPIDPLHAVAILNEEIGELNQAILKAVYDHTGPYNLIDVEEEAIQVAAAILMFIKHSNKYEYVPCEQTSL